MSILLSLIPSPIISHLNSPITNDLILGTVIIGAIMIVPVMYYWMSVDGVDAPPYLPILYPIVSGQIDLKSEGPLGLVKYGYQHFGDIFRFRVFHQPITMMIGPEANRCVFEAKDSVLSQKECYSFTIPVFGKGIVYDSPNKLFMQQLKMIGKGLSAFTMQSYSGKIVKEVEAYFASWPESGEVDLFKELSDVLILTASRCLLGAEIRENVQTEFAGLYQELSDGMNHLSYFFPNAPTTRHRRRDAARAKIVKIFSDVIQTRRKNGSPLAENDWDFLQILMDARYTDGTPLTDDEISGMLIAALFAGQHTSNITSTWTGLEILAQKETLLPRILAEQERVLASTGGEITLDSLNEMELLHNCMKETLRLHPPLILLMRKALEPVQYKGYTIPKGDMVVVCPPVSHMLPEVFSNPTQYDPDRYSEPRCEDTQHKFSYLAFGGGRHGCLGERFGYLQVKTLWSYLFRTFDFELIGEFPKSDYTTIVIGPTPPVMVKFKRRHVQ